MNAFPVIKELVKDRNGDGYLTVTDEGMDLRDYFATHATDADVDLYKDLVPQIEKKVETYSGVTYVMRLPDNWRTIARYMHADAMMEARGS